jgi:hypothetical protein
MQKQEMEFKFKRICKKWVVRNRLKFKLRINVIDHPADKQADGDS